MAISKLAFSAALFTMLAVTKAQQAIEGDTDGNVIVSVNGAASKLYVRRSGGQQAAVAMDSDVSTLMSTVQAQASTISALQSNISMLQSMVVNSQASTISELRSNVSMLQTSVTDAIPSQIATAIADSQSGSNVTGYRAAFSNPPAPGWSYKWNPTAPIGTSSAYASMTWDSAASRYSATSLGQRWMSLSSTGGHPGYSADPALNRLWATYAIAAYTVPSAGLYALDGWMSDANVAAACGTSGRVGSLCSNNVKVFVDDTLIWGGNTSGTENISLSTSLGWVNAGQSVYVAFGPGLSDAYDTFYADFNLVRGVGPALQVLSQSVVSNNDAYTWRNVTTFLTGLVHNRSSGWEFMWNPSGPIGNPANYQQMQPSQSPNAFRPYGSDTGGPSTVNRTLAGWAKFSVDGAAPSMHPGPTQNEGAPQDIYVIGAFPVPETAHYSITNSMLRDSNPNYQEDGVVLRIYVGSTLKYIKQCTQSKPNHFDMPLGMISRGTFIYVAVGPGESSGSDTFVMDFAIGRGIPAMAMAVQPNVEDKITTGLGNVVAQFPRDFATPGIFTYAYNTGPISNATSYTPLQWNTARTQLTCNGGTTPVNATGCSALPYLSISNSGRTHPGRTLNGNDIYAIIQYSVPYDGYYTLSDSLLTGLSSSSSGYHLVIYVRPSGGAQFRALSRDVFPQVVSGVGNRNQWQFDAVLGFLGTGTTIAIGVGPSGSDGADSNSIQFKISTGPIPAITPRSSGNGFPGKMPLLNGFGPTTVTTVSWSGTSAANTWQTVLTGNYANPTLEDGIYLCYIADFDTFRSGANSYSEEIISAPFVWENAGTNGHNADDSTAIATHQAGHADNNEVISLQTDRQLRGQLVFQFQSNRAWTRTVSFEISFYRLL